MDVFIHDRILLWTAAAIYCAAFVMALGFLVRSKQHSRPVLYTLVAAGFLVQTGGLYLRGITAASCPLGNTFEILQFIVWSFALLYLVVGPAFRMSLLGFFTSGLASGLAIVSLSVGSWDGVRDPTLLGPNPWIAFHAAGAVFSYGVFSLLALTSFMYLLQNHSLRAHKFRGLFPFLPSILQLEQMNVRLLLTGVLILTLSLAIGAVHWGQDPASVNWLKLLPTLSIWLAYLAAFTLRRINILLSRGLAWVCIGLFFLALLSIGPIAGNRSLPPSTPETSAAGPPWTA